MPRHSISDINPPKRTIRDIPVPPHRRPREIEVEETENYEPPHNNEMMRRRRFRFFGKLPVVIGIIILGVFGFLGVQLFRVHATVTVLEKEKDISIDGSFLAKKDAKEGELPFETVSASKENSKTVPATGEKQVETRSSGTIIIYNNYSNATQRLIKNTRFETTDGRIYRIDQSVTVPGKDKDTGAPGQVETLVYADSAGEAYNIGLSDFTIPGFKGDPRYSKFFARSKTTMTGGFIGKIKTASSEDLKKAKQELETTLRDEVTKAIEGQVPEGFVLFKSALYINLETLSPPDSNELKEKATAYGVLFNEKKLASSIALATIADYDKSEILAKDLQNILFTPIPPDAKPWQTGVVSFSLKGTTTLVWLFDQEKLKNDLVGQPKEKARIATILEAYPSIDHAEVVVRPFWRSTLPTKVEDITIKTEKAGEK